MQEKEFRKLLEKSIKNTLTKEEEALLDQFHKNLEAQEKESLLSPEQKRELKETIWSSVVKGTNRKETIVTRKLLASVAAIFIGVTALGYLFLQQNTNNLETLPSDVITLQLEDGTIKVLGEKDVTNIVDKTGNIISQQNNNQLVYSGNQSDRKELVYNTLTIPYGKTFKLVLSDGTKVHLNAGSSLRYPIQFLSGMERTVFVTGEIFLDVAKDLEHPFIVNADNLNVKVLGTQFNVNAYPEDQIAEVVLVEGSVSLYAKKSKSKEVLKPGFKASFNRKEENIVTNKVLTGIYTSWMDGELVFRNMSFNNILKKLERYYDVKIINNNHELSAEKFNASFGSNPIIEDVLEELKITYDLDYKIEENSITIN